MDNPFTIIQEEIHGLKSIILELQSTVKSLIEERPETLLSPEEARNVFKPSISKSTLNRWQKKGVIKRHIKGGRVFYKLSEISEVAKSSTLYKANCPVETGQFLQ